MPKLLQSDYVLSEHPSNSPVAFCTIESMLIIETNDVAVITYTTEYLKTQV